MLRPLAANQLQISAEPIPNSANCFASTDTAIASWAPLRPKWVVVSVIPLGQGWAEIISLTLSLASPWQALVKWLKSGMHLRAVSEGEDSYMSGPHPDSSAVVPSHPFASSGSTLTLLPVRNVLNSRGI